VAHTGSHISEQDLILAADGELSKRQMAAVSRHLDGCGMCRTRMKEIEDTIARFVRVYRDTLDPEIPSSLGPRALLRARLSQLAAERPPSRCSPLARFCFDGRRAAYAAGTFAVAIAVLMFLPSSQPSLAWSPNPQLTPGVILPLSAADVCGKQIDGQGHAVLASLGKQVFAQYGINNPQPRRYEMDYLIDPDLGGADDPRNLWPQPYSALWNANVKDALEEHLRESVCANRITLAQAQRDISIDWIAAYKSYFHTDRPLPRHRTFRKDQPWE